MLEFIPVYVWGILLLVGILGLVFKNSLSTRIASTLGSPLGLKTSTALMILLIGALAFGGIGVVQGWAGGVMGTATVTGIDAVEGTCGLLNVKLHDGLSNDSTSEDYLNDAKDFMSVYSADAEMTDGLEYVFNATIYRSNVGEDCNLKIACTMPDKELAGVTENTLAEKTSGQIDLDINDEGTHSDDNTVWTYVALSESTVSTDVEIAYDHDEEYHDGMTDLDDYTDLSCSATAQDGNVVTWTHRVLANS